MFMHFEVEGDAMEIARTVRAAWETLAGSIEVTAPRPFGHGPLRIDFDGGEADILPADFTTALTGGGGPVSWVTKADPTARSGGKVLAQTSTDDTDNRFPLAVYEKFTAKDVSVSVHFKAVAGQVDQAAGLVARYRDANNYYITRANALEGNVRLYKVEGGRRKQFAGANCPVPSGEWQTLTLVVKGKHFNVFFNDKLLIEADDEAFSEAGKVGLWTKADSVTYFDDLTVEELKP